MLMQFAVAPHVVMRDELLKVVIGAELRLEDTPLFCGAIGSSRREVSACENERNRNTGFSNPRIEYGTDGL